MAEREGFEPSKGFPPYSLSRGAPSTTRPPLLLYGKPLYLAVQSFSSILSIASTYIEPTPFTSLFWGKNEVFYSIFVQTIFVALALFSAVMILPCLPNSTSPVLHVTNTVHEQFVRKIFLRQLRFSGYEKRGGSVSTLIRSARPID